MFKKTFLVFAVMIAMATAIVWAQETNQKVGLEPQEREAIKGSLNAMSNEELKSMVLQHLEKYPPIHREEGGESDTLCQKSKDCPTGSYCCCKPSCPRGDRSELCTGPLKNSGECNPIMR